MPIAELLRRRCHLLSDCCGDADALGRPVCLQRIPGQRAGDKAVLDKVRQTSKLCLVGLFSDGMSTLNRCHLLSYLVQYLETPLKMKYKTVTA
jgi:hypothetical protein